MIMGVRDIFQSVKERNASRIQGFTQLKDIGGKRREKVPLPNKKSRTLPIVEPSNPIPQVTKQ